MPLGNRRFSTSHGFRPKIAHSFALNMPIYWLNRVLGGAGMSPGQRLAISTGATEGAGFVSGRFLTDFFRSLERQDVPATQLLGDLPIPVDETGRVTRSIDWVDFVDFMKRLEHHAGGMEELIACGERICDREPTTMLHTLVGLATSPYSLYRAASRWALRRAIPGLQTSIKEVAPNRIEIKVHLSEGMRPCPQLFQLAIGSARALPRILGLNDAVVTARIEEFDAEYLITVPASRTPWARLTRLFRMITSAKSVLGFLEAQQLELHAKHEELELAKNALAASECRHRTLTDAAVDVLCELDETGHIVYVSASVMDLMGYTPEQVTGSHFSLWIPGDHRAIARERFEVFASQSVPQTVTRLRVQLHTESGGHIVAELSLRPYRTPEGEVRMVVILRDETDRPLRESKRSRNEKKELKRNSVRALRERLEKSQTSTIGHPIERSLTLLLASLDTSLGEPDDFAMGRTISSTDRMTRIVERALAISDDPSANFRWHEMAKFTERIRAEFHSDSANAGRSLRIEKTNAPALFWCEDGLLIAGLGSLLDWTAERTSPQDEIFVEIEELEESQNETRILVFSVGRAMLEESTSSSNDTHNTESTRSNLALATAKDAANALGGDIHLDGVAPGCLISRLRIPQPRDTRR
jgi:PAS domain S-box-containing protein